MTPRSEVFALIPARGGSKGIPRKNLRQLAGKPLIAYAIQTAIGSSLIDRVIVSTEDSEIADVARIWGAEVPFMRPPELALDDSPEWLTWQHAIRSLKAADSGFQPQVLVCVPPTSPLRSIGDVDACIKTLLESDADVVISAKNAERSPYFNMVALNADGYVRLAVSAPKQINRRQDAPQLYDLTTVAYAARPDFVLHAKWMFEGRVKAVLVPRERALDIDTEMDLAFAEYLLTRWQPDQLQAREDSPGRSHLEPSCER